TECNLAALTKCDAAFEQKDLVWQEVLLPEFGMRKLPDWEGVYFIGDALGSFPPAAGGGVQCAIGSSLMSINYFLKNDLQGYRKASQTRFSKQLFWASLLHKTMLSALLSRMAIKTLSPTMIDSLLHHIAI